MRIWLKMEILLSSFRSQADFANTIGKSEYWLSRVIHGRIHPKDDEEELIASTLGVERTERLFFVTES